MLFGMKGKVPILSAEAIHQLHIFIFVLAVTHFLLSAITVLLGIAQVPIKAQTRCLLLLTSNYSIILFLKLFLYVA